MLTWSPGFWESCASISWKTRFVFSRSITSAASKFATHSAGTGNSRKPWTAEEDERLLHMRREGFKYAEVANALDRSLDSVKRRIYYALKPEDLIRRNDLPPFTKEDIRTMVRLRNKGETWQKIQQDFPSRSLQSIRHHIVSASPELSTTGRRGGIFSSQDDAKILQLRDVEKLRWKDIALAFEQSAIQIARRYRRISRSAEQTKVHGEKPPITFDEIPQIKRMRENGLSWRAIRNALDQRSSTAKIFNMYKAYEEGTIFGYREPSSGRFYTRTEDARIQQLVAQGLTPKQIAPLLSERSELSVVRRLLRLATVRKPEYGRVKSK